MGTRKIRGLLINPGFQGAIILYALVLSFLLAILQYGALKFFFHKYDREGADIGLKPDHPFFRFIQEQERYMNRVFIVTSLILIVVTVISGLILSHRIAGPIYRLKEYFSALKDGPTDELKFRKGDFFQELPPVINEGLSHARNGAGMKPE